MPAKLIAISLLRSSRTQGSMAQPSLRTLFPFPVATPVLCMLAAVGALSAAGTVTFTETIAPIVYENCLTCHRPGEAAPFALITYEDVKKRGSLIAAVTKSGYMPPWHAAHGYGEFGGERRLSDT